MSSSGRSGGGTTFAQGTAAARPATPATQFYWANDTQELSVANPGSTGWLNIAKTTGNFNPTNNLTVGGNLGFTGSSAFMAGGASSVLLSSGDMDVNSAGRGFRANEGANGKQGTIAAMTAGSIAVSNTSVTANSRIYPMRGAGGTNPGAWFVSAQTAGTGFTVTSTNAADTGTGWFVIFEPG